MVMKIWRRDRQSQAEHRDQLEEDKMMQGFYSLGSKACGLFSSACHRMCGIGVCCGLSWALWVLSVCRSQGQGMD